MQLQWRRALRVLVPVLFLPFAAGCKMSVLRVELVDYAAGHVEGMWLWRLSEATSAFERTSRITLETPQLGPDGETVGYVQECLDGTTGGSFESRIVRVADQPDVARLRLVFFGCDGGAGLYKASAYNAQGESELSEAAVVL